MKYFYYAATREQNGKNYAFVIKSGAGDNLLSVFARYSNLKFVNACPTKKAAEKLADFWNECYEKNGTSAF